MSSSMEPESADDVIEETDRMIEKFHAEQPWDPTPWLITVFFAALIMVFCLVETSMIFDVPCHHAQGHVGEP